MKDRIVVSVCMITYNHENFIREALDGVLNQVTSFDFELIICDDFSNDGTADVINEYLRSSDKAHMVRYIRHNSNIGMVANSVACTDLASGEYLAFCEGDDFWIDYHKLQRQYDFLEKNKDAVYCAHRYKILDHEEGSLLRSIYPLYFSRYSKIDVDLDDLAIVEVNKFNYCDDFFTLPLSVFTRTSDFKKIESFHESFNYFRDYHLYYLLLNLGKGYCMDFVGGVYRRHRGGIHSSKEQGLKSTVSLKIYEELYFFDRNPIFIIKYWEALIILIIRGHGITLFRETFVNRFNFYDKILFFLFFIPYGYKKIKEKLF
jgi:glycosyltransferase involved in cell wall biosynthesis